MYLGNCTTMTELATINLILDRTPLFSNYQEKSFKKMKKIDKKYQLRLLKLSSQNFLFYKLFNSIRSNFQIH